jgi:hypothetical protein
LAVHQYQVERVSLAIYSDCNFLSNGITLITISYSNTEGFRADLETLLKEITKGGEKRIIVFSQWWLQQDDAYQEEEYRAESYEPNDIVAWACKIVH